MKKTFRLLGIACGFFCTLCTSTDLFAQNFEWVKSSGSTNDDCFIGATCDNAGNSYSTGMFQGSVDFGTGLNAAQGSYDICITKRDASGNILWVKTYGGTASDQGDKISVAPDGTLGIVGSFKSSFIDFGNGHILTNPHAPTRCIFVLKLDANGVTQWADCGVSAGLSTAAGIACLPTGGIMIAGTYRDTITFGQIPPLVTCGLDDFFVALYDASGNVVSAKHGGTIYNDGANAIACDLYGNVYVTGNVNQNQTQPIAAQYDTVYDMTPSGQSTFLLKMNSQGSGLLLKTYGGSGCIADAYALAVTPLGTVWFGGTFTGTITFGTFPLTAQSTSGDGFSVEVTPTASILSAHSLGTSGTGLAAVYGMCADVNENVTIVGTYQGTIQAPGQYSFSSLAGSYDAMILTLNHFGYVWGKSVGGGSGSDAAYSVARDGLGNTYVAGTLGSNPTSFDTTQVNCAGQGDAFSTKLEPGPTGLHDAVSAPSIISLFPNPCSGSFHVLLPNTTACTVSMYDTAGKKVYATVIENSTDVPIEGLPDGIYVVKVEGEKINYSERIVVIQ